MKKMFFSLLLTLLTITVVSQEVKPNIPPSDKGVREQTTQEGRDTPAIIIERINDLDLELEAIMIEAEESGRETERYQSLVNGYKQRREKISRYLEEGYEPESETEQEIRLLEAQLQAIRKEVGMAEPGTPD
jgi:peptidoglycan hydrolase CwlO-like protein